MTVIGTRLPRQEDPRLLRGRGRFGDDFSAPGQLWARIVRSPSAHGQVRELDVTAAARAPGITEIVTANDLPGQLVIPVRLAIAGTDLSDFLQPVLAADTVRYVGEPLAVVVGDDPYACEDAAELVEIDITDQPAVLDAGRDDARSDRDNTIAELTRGYGDTDAAFAAAAYVVQIELAIGRHSGVPLEPRCLLAVPDPDRGVLDIFGMTKVPVWNRDLLADMLGVDETQIRVHAIDAGGGFGVRGEFYPEDFLIPWLAAKTGRPVKWTEDRAEHLVAVNHSRQQHHRVAAAFDADGRILGLTDDITQDNGAYCRTHGVAVPELTAAMLPGPYRVPAYRGQVRVVLTNKTPCGTYRAPGRFEGTAAREHLLDVAATQLGIDPIKLRMRNLLTPSEMPHERPISTLGTDLILDTGDYPALLAAAVKEADRLGYRTQANDSAGPGSAASGCHVRGEERPRAAGDRRRDRQQVRRRARLLRRDLAGPGHRDRARADHRGRPRCRPADRARDGGRYGRPAVRRRFLGVPVDRGGRQRRTPGCARGPEAGAATGRADAGGRRGGPRPDRRVGQRPRRPGPGVPENGPPQPGRYRPGGGAGQPLPGKGRAGLSARRRFEVSHMTYPYGAHAAVVEVDTGTGQVRVLRYLVAYEVGRAINPMLVEGQLRGGVAQGIGGALFEEFRYDEAGQPQAITFIEYRLPTAAEIPPVDVLLSQDAPSPGNPLGVMGAGEGGINAVGAAVANAVRDALGLAAGVGQLPLTPARVRALCEPTREGTEMTTEVPGYVSKTDLVAALIRELIITGQLDPGEQLRQRDLAQRFGVSQTPVREAMRRLESEGLLVCDTHRGFTVVTPDVGRLEENFQIRAALESLGASLAARKIDPRGLDRLRALNSQMRALADDDPGYAELNREFHFTVYEYAGSPLLLSLMRLLWASLHGGPRVSRTHAESARQHDEILDALTEGDAAAASARTYQHIMGADPVKEVSEPGL